MTNGAVLMTVYKPKGGKTWRYDFRWKGRRYQGSTDQLTKADAVLAESAVKKRLRRQAWDIDAVEDADSPTFTDWAPTVLADQRRRITRVDLQERTFRMVLAFFGRRPTRSTPIDGGPYHDLRLIDPIRDADWIVKFEDWMETRGIAGSTKNSYRSALSAFYRVALLPKYRKVTGVTMNPVDGVARDAGNTRTQTLTVEQIHAWMREASPHVRLAIAIATLAPKLRLASILALRWDRHIDSDLRFITVAEHKTVRTSGAAQVVPVDPQLREILQPERAKWKARKGPASVIHFRGAPVKSIKTALKRAATDAGIPYGINAITFHSLRHTMATLLAELGVPEKQRQAVMGHLEIRTTQRYTHLRPLHEVGPLAQLSGAVPLRALFGLSGANSEQPNATGNNHEEKHAVREKGSDVETGT